jgi:hypothetical protein
MEKAKLDLRHVTRKNTTMLLQIRFMEAQVEMLQKEKLSLETHSSAPLSQHQENSDLLQQLVHEQEAHAATKLLCSKLRQSLYSLLGMIDIYGSEVEQFIESTENHMSFIMGLLGPSDSAAAMDPLTRYRL